MEVAKMLALIPDFNKKDVQFLKAAKEGIPLSEAEEAQLTKFTKYGIISVSPLQHPKALNLTSHIVVLTDDGERLVNSILQESEENEKAGMEAPKPSVNSRYREDLRKDEQKKLTAIREANNPVTGKLREIADLDRPYEDSGANKIDPVKANEKTKEQYQDQKASDPNQTDNIQKVAIVDPKTGK